MAGGACAKAMAAETMPAAASTEIWSVFMTGSSQARTIDPGNPKPQIPNQKCDLEFRAWNSGLGGFGLGFWGLGLGIWDLLVIPVAVAVIVRWIVRIGRWWRRWLWHVAVDAPNHRRMNRAVVGRSRRRQRYGSA